MIDETDQVPGERRRLVDRGHRTGGGGACMLVVIQETGGAGAVHRRGASGVRPSRADLVALAEKILERAT
ncbi:MAG: hypothetical protein ACRDRP_15330 [Pseudonocardiaceae bacterium]